MDSPRSGFRRAAVASWALAGMGVAGVAGASTLAYVDTVKPVAEAPAEVAIPAAPKDIGLPPAADVAPVPDVVTPTVEPPPPPPVTSDTPVPAYTPTPKYTTPEYTPTPQYTPTPVYTPTPQYTQAPEYTQAPPSATQPQPQPTTKRRASTPTTVLSPNYSPPVTVSRGS